MCQNPSEQLVETKDRSLRLGVVCQNLHLILSSMWFVRTSSPIPRSQSACVAPLLKEQYRTASLARTGIVLTIHNIAFQV